MTSVGAPETPPTPSPEWPECPCPNPHFSGAYPSWWGRFRSWPICPLCSSSSIFPCLHPSKATLEAEIVVLLEQKDQFAEEQPSHLVQTFNHIYILDRLLCFLPRTLHHHLHTYQFFLFTTIFTSSLSSDSLSTIISNNYIKIMDYTYRLPLYTKL